MEKVYIDANIFLNPVLYNINEVEEAKKSQKFLKEVISKKIVGVTSVLTWDEFVWIIRKNLGKKTASEKGKELLIFPNLSFISVTFSTILRAQDLLSKYNIKPRDAIHVASMIENNITKLISFDGDFDDISEIERKEP